MVLAGDGAGAEGEGPLDPVAITVELRLLPPPPVLVLLLLLLPVLPAAGVVMFCPLSLGEEGVGAVPGEALFSGLSAGGGVPGAAASGGVPAATGGEGEGEGVATTAAGGGVEVDEGEGPLEAVTCGR